MTCAASFGSNQGLYAPTDQDMYGKYLYVLHQDSLKKMLVAAQKTKETDLTDSLKLDVSNLPTFYALMLDDYAIFTRASSGETETDQKVAKILEDFESKIEALNEQ